MDKVLQNKLDLIRQIESFPKHIENWERNGKIKGCQKYLKGVVVEKTSPASIKAPPNHPARFPYYWKYVNDKLPIFGGHTLNP